MSRSFYPKVKIPNERSRRFSQRLCRAPVGSHNESRTPSAPRHECPTSPAPMRPARRLPSRRVALSHPRTHGTPHLLCAAGEGRSCPSPRGSAPGAGFAWTTTSGWTGRRRSTVKSRPDGRARSASGPRETPPPPRSVDWARARCEGERRSRRGSWTLTTTRTRATRPALVGR